MFLSLGKPSFGPLRVCATLFGLSILIGSLSVEPIHAATDTVASTPNPILFVTQVPVPADFATIGSVFANQSGGMQSVARGGDLWIRYADGTLRNLTQEAGYGNDGRQGANSIAVRDPAVNFSGDKAVFSMIVGAPTAQYQVGEWFWQLYEISGFGAGQTISITRVANQPADYNNIEPTYGSDGSLIFTSDRPRNGQRYLYPQFDEYESQPTTTGVWRLDAASGALSLLQHSPSGSSGPFVDSFGRVIFTRWDHLQTDQQASTDASNEAAGNPPTYGTFDYASEASNAARLPRATEMFPDPLYAVPGSNVNGHRFNFFFPWMVNQDGSGEETLNHIGRHELQNYFERSFTNDPALYDFIDADSDRTNQNPVENVLQLAEDPSHPGRYYAIDAPEFYTHAAGQLISIDGAPGTNASTMAITYHSPRNGSSTFDGPPTSFAGRYRNPLPLADGTLVAAYTDQWDTARNTGSRANPQSNYAFRLYQLNLASDQITVSPGAPLTAGISKSISYWDPDVLVTYAGPLWEFSPVEVHARSTPPQTAIAAMATPETSVFTDTGVDPAEFSAFLRARGLGVLVSRDVTARDSADHQQPYNLRVPGGTQTIGNNGQLYDIAWMQMFQGDQLRGMGGTANPRDGRRVLAKPLHDESAFAFMPPTSGGPAGAVAIAADGSIAAIVPAQRAMSWQTTDASGTPVVRERYWITVQPGEVRACDGCHGVNEGNQAGQPAAQNPPLALRELLLWYRDHSNDVFANGFD